MARPKIADELRCKTTSIRLRPDRLSTYKELGGVKWLNAILDSEKRRNVDFDVVFEEANEVG